MFLFKIDLIGEGEIQEESNNEILTLQEQVVEETRVKREAPGAYESGSSEGCECIVYVRQCLSESNINGDGNRGDGLMV